MVCKHEDTISLLEVSDTAKEQYLKQSKATSEPFLMKAIDIANNCDINYKASKNHRLLVELSLMKMASLQFDSEKKNPDLRSSTSNPVYQLIPASHFKRKQGKITSDSDWEGGTTEKIEVESVTIEPATEEIAEPSPTVEEEVIVATKPKIQLGDQSKRVSGLSISSLKAKRAHELNKIEVVIDENDLPHDPFEEEEMQNHWAAYVQELDQAGRKILASNLSIDQPKLLGDNTIWIQLPNSTMKKEIEREQSGLIKFLKTRLNNYDISLKISVNEEHAKRFVYTPEEKYEKLRKKNPAIDLLRKEFDLDL